MSHGSLASPATRTPASARAATPAFLHRAVLARPWVIPAGPLEYHDACFAADDPTQWTLTAVPRSALRHAFQISHPLRLAEGEWAVDVTPRRLDAGPGAQAGASPDTAAPRPRRMKLLHHGCVAFELVDLPQAAPGAQHALMFRAGPGGLDATPGPVLSMKIPMQPHHALAGSGGTPFETLPGEAGVALQSMLDQAQLARDSEMLTGTRLMTLRKPAGIGQEAWDAACLQLSLEAVARERCDRYFERCETFIQNVFIAQSIQVVKIAQLCCLDRPIDDKQLIDGAFKLMTAALSAIDIPGFGAVSGALGAAYAYLASQRDAASTAVENTATLGAAADAFEAAFESLIQAIHAGRAAVFKDWGILSGLAKTLQEHPAQADPASDKALHDKTIKDLKLTIWKVLLKQRWNDVYDAKPHWCASYTAADKKRFEDAHPGHYVSFQPGGNPADKHHTPGFLVSDHYLGRGDGGLFAPNAPDDAMLQALIALGVKWEEVFTGWGLTAQAYTLPEPYGPTYVSGM